MRRGLRGLSKSDVPGSTILSFCEGRSHSLPTHSSPRLSTGSINPLVCALNTVLCLLVQPHCRLLQGRPHTQCCRLPDEVGSSNSHFSDSDTESRSALLTSTPHCFLFKKKNAAPKTQFRIFTTQEAKRLKALVTETWDSPWLGVPCIASSRPFLSSLIQCKMGSAFEMSSCSPQSLG